MPGQGTIVSWGRIWRIGLTATQSVTEHNQLCAPLMTKAWAATSKEDQGYDERVDFNFPLELGIKVTIRKFGNFPRI